MTHLHKDAPTTIVIVPSFYCKDPQVSFFSNKPHQRNTVRQFNNSDGPYFFGFLKILKVCFLRLAVESVSSPVEPLSSSRGLFLEDSCGMRLLPLDRPTWPPVGDGVSGSVELGLREREDSDMLLMSPRLGDCSMPYSFFRRRGLSVTVSGGLPSCMRFPPLGVKPCNETLSSPRPCSPWMRDVGLIRWPLEL